MEIKGESPWSVANIHEFLYFCCPECDEKKKSEELFIGIIHKPRGQIFG